jgi:hypothetical protein
MKESKFFLKSLGKRLPSWYLPVFGLLLVLWVAFSIFYHMGAAGVSLARSGGFGHASFDRGSDYQLYKVDDSLAYFVDIGTGLSSLVRVRKAPVPFCFLCGRYVNNGPAVSDSGPFPGFPEVKDRMQLKAEKIAQAFPPMSTLNTSCIPLQGAFLLLAGVLLLLGLVLLLLSVFRKKRKEDPRHDQGEP